MSFAAASNCRAIVALLGVSAESGGGGNLRPLALTRRGFLSRGPPYPQTVPQFWTRFCTPYIDSPFAAPTGAAPFLLSRALPKRVSAWCNGLSRSSTLAPFKD